MSVVPRLGRTALEEEIGSEGRLHHLPVVWTWAIGISSLNLSVSSLTSGKKKENLLDNYGHGKDWMLFNFEVCLYMFKDTAT